MKLCVNSRARICAEEFLKRVSLLCILTGLIILYSSVLKVVLHLQSDPKHLT